MKRITTAAAAATQSTQSTLRLAPGVGQPILTGSRAVSDTRPFVQKCLNARVGDETAKLVLLAYACYVDVWTGYEGGVSLAGQETIRRQCEVAGKRRFREALRYLAAAGFLVVRRRGPGKTARTTVCPVPMAVVQDLPRGGTSRLTPHGGHKKDQSERPVEDLYHEDLLGRTGTDGGGYVQGAVICRCDCGGFCHADGNGGTECDRCRRVRTRFDYGEPLPKAAGGGRP